MTMRESAPIVLFDLDDTLLAHREAVERGILLHMRERAYSGEALASQRFWYDLEEEHYHAYLAGHLTFEQQRRARARAFAIAHGDELDEAAAGAWFARYFEHYRESWALHDDAIPALDALADALPRVRLGVITNGELDYQTAKLQRLGILDRFEHVIASGEVGVTKPDERIFRVALERFGGDAHATPAAYVGDRLVTDAVGAAAAGLIGVWLHRPGAPSGAGESGEAEASGVHEIAGLAELAPLLAEQLDR
ncbi:HAD family hydrolase [Agromyces ramosus]|uniref:Hydrolase of the HAD superfamily n=1 Tax=Agromyces ramosus TaxID=33879 RepID=A0ABU0RBB1_9MICO|nr:HAD family hydrolase [Agromyces ramosus]MDQ0895351.1 putative hydrolase of the HAD superfamily [Agromyces ramosus]